MPSPPTHLFAACQPSQAASQPSLTDRQSLAMQSVGADWLEVRDGETDQPIRPLCGDRVLIGGGSQCAIQITADGVAMVHAVMTRTEAEWHLESFAADPAVLVNGEPIRERRLRSGDLIGLAGVNLVLRTAATAVQSAAVPDAPDAPDAPDVGTSAATLPLFAEVHPSEMTAAELVDALGDELAMLAELGEDETPVEMAMPETARDPHRVRGLATLLRAAREFDNVAGPSTIPLPTTERERTIRPRDAA